MESLSTRIIVSLSMRIIESLPMHIINNLFVCIIESLSACIIESLSARIIARLCTRIHESLSVRIIARLCTRIRESLSIYPYISLQGHFSKYNKPQVFLLMNHDDLMNKCFLSVVPTEHERFKGWFDTLQFASNPRNRNLQKVSLRKTTVSL